MELSAPLLHPLQLLLAVALSAFISPESDPFSYPCNAGVNLAQCAFPFLYTLFHLAAISGTVFLAGPMCAAIRSALAGPRPTDT